MTIVQVYTRLDNYRYSYRFIVAGGSYVLSYISHFEVLVYILYAIVVQQSSYYALLHRFNII